MVEFTEHVTFAVTGKYYPPTGQLGSNADVRLDVPQALETKELREAFRALAERLAGVGKTLEYLRTMVLKLKAATPVAPAAAHWEPTDKQLDVALEVVENAVGMAHNCAAAIVDAFWHHIRDNWLPLMQAATPMVTDAMVEAVGDVLFEPGWNGPLGHGIDAKRDKIRRIIEAGLGAK